MGSINAYLLELKFTLNKFACADFGLILCIRYFFILMSQCSQSFKINSQLNSRSSGYLFKLHFIAKAKVIFLRYHTHQGIIVFEKKSAKLHQLFRLYVVTVKDCNKFKYFYFEIEEMRSHYKHIFCFILNLVLVMKIFKY